MSGETWKSRRWLALIRDHQIEENLIVLFESHGHVVQPSCEAWKAAGTRHARLNRPIRTGDRRGRGARKHSGAATYAGPQQGARSGEERIHA